MDSPPLPKISSFFHVEREDKSVSGRKSLQGCACINIYTDIMTYGVK